MSGERKEAKQRRDLPTITVIADHGEYLPGNFYASDESYTTYNQSIRMVKENDDGRLLAVFLKGILLKHPDLIDIGRGLRRYKGTSVKRADASGQRLLVEGKQNHGGVAPEHKKHHLGASVSSSIVGYSDPDNYHPCRQTALYRKNKDYFDNETLRLIKKISDLFKEYCPEEYSRQKAFVDQCNQYMVLPDTVYTTLTVNCDWRTAAHTDKGDYRAGLGNLCVFKDGNYSGGELLIPKYKVCFNMEEGDVLFMDSHELHCNNPISGTGRISLICYAREQILYKCSNVSKEEVENPVSYRNREKRQIGVCTRCGATETKQWRFTDQDECLCNPCGLKYKMQQRKEREQMEQ